MAEAASDLMLMEPMLAKVCLNGQPATALVDNDGVNLRVGGASVTLAT
jgi:hypothetical protein